MSPASATGASIAYKTARLIVMSVMSIILMTITTAQVALSMSLPARYTATLTSQHRCSMAQLTLIFTLAFFDAVASVAIRWLALAAFAASIK